MARFWYGREHAAAVAADCSPLGGPAAFCPVARRKLARHHEPCLVPVLAGYAFVEMEPDDPYRWHDVAALSGFLGFIGGIRPEPVKAGLVEALMARSDAGWVMEAELPSRVVSLSRGAEVKFQMGHLAGCLGVVEWTRRRVDGPVAQVRVSGLFKIEMRVEVSVEHLERVSKDEVKRGVSLLDLPVIRPAALLLT